MFLRTDRVDYFRTLGTTIELFLQSFREHHRRVGGVDCLLDDDGTSPLFRQDFGMNDVLK